LAQTVHHIGAELDYPRKAVTCTMRVSVLIAIAQEDCFALTDRNWRETVAEDDATAAGMTCMPASKTKKGVG
jgi:hypothetical protein